ncbi:MAG: cytochrome c [Proteobacteria bacterium]|nr:cytochrome c [Pseudomonadota bacterium]
MTAQAATASRYFLGALAVALLLAWPCPRAWSQGAGDPAAGRTLAEGWCSACHVVTPDQHGASSNGAPPFAVIARMKWATPTSLRVFLQTPHNRMPDLHLTRGEIADVSAYILSLRTEP